MTLSRRSLIQVGAATAGITAAGLGASSSPAFSATQTALEKYQEPGELEMSIDHQIFSFARLYYPTNIRDLGKLPVIVWGNGTFGATWHYQELFRHWVSRGYVVAASKSPNPLFGILMMEGLNDLLRKSNDPNSLYYQRIDADRIATSGHSQGGFSCLYAALDERVTTAMPIQPGPVVVPGFGQRCPVLLSFGENDDLVDLPFLLNYKEWLFRDTARLPMVYGLLRKATHYTVTSNYNFQSEDGGGFKGITAAWLEAFFKEDNTARKIFFGQDFALPKEPNWTEVFRNEAGDNYWPWDESLKSGVSVEQLDQRILNEGKK